MKGLYLLNVEITETNAIKLKFLDENGKVNEIIDEGYKPYFLAPFPLNN